MCLFVLSGRVSGGFLFLLLDPPAPDPGFFFWHVFLFLSPSLSISSVFDTFCCCRRCNIFFWIFLCFFVFCCVFLVFALYFFCPSLLLFTHELFLRKYTVCFLACLLRRRGKGKGEKGGGLVGLSIDLGKHSASGRAFGGLRRLSRAKRCLVCVSSTYAQNR